MIPSPTPMARRLTSTPATPLDGRRPSTATTSSPSPGDASPTPTADASPSAPSDAAYRVLPCSRAEHRRFVALHHSHHEAALGERFALRAVVNHQTVAVVVVGDPVAQELRQQGAWEVTRLAIGPMSSGIEFVASRLLGAAWRQMRIYDVRRAVSYTRIDERGTCYRAAGWVPVAVVRGRAHDTGNRRGRWLPGLADTMASTKTIDRVRWEIGPDASKTRVSL